MRLVKELLKGNRDAAGNLHREEKIRGYDFFPNCANNAFEVATAALKDRVKQLRERRSGTFATGWPAQDVVFENCSGGAKTPDPGGQRQSRLVTERSRLSNRGRVFYSLNFDEARRRFELIANDLESPWRETARYLVVRTLVRQASLTKSEGLQRDLYEKAEVELQNLIGQRRKLSSPRRDDFGA